MAQKKSHEVDAWLRRPDKALSVILLYGPDRGLVSERATVFARNTGLPIEDPFTVIRIDATETAQDGRLLDEARTVPMFADQRLVWVKGISQQAHIVEDVKVLLEKPPQDAIILLEAGDLKKTSPLRKIIEAANNAMALPCYADDGRGINSLIDEGLSKANLQISLEARNFLKANLGGDRLASRGEIEKLALYCAGQQEVTIGDIRVLIGDVSANNIDEIVDAIFVGRIDEFDQLYSRYVSGGNAPFLILSAALRHSYALQILREQIENGAKNASSAVASARPPIFFTRKNDIETTLTRWPLIRLQAASERLYQAILRTRQQTALAVAVTRQALLAISIEAARSGRHSR